MVVDIIGVGDFRRILKTTKVPFEVFFAEGIPVTVEMVVDALDKQYDGAFKKELYLANGEPNLWTRIMLNGRDIRFLEKDKLFVHNGDSILISSVMAGG